MFLCVCLPAFVRACVRACVRGVCVCVCTKRTCTLNSLDVCMCFRRGMCFSLVGKTDTKAVGPMFGARNLEVLTHALGSLRCFLKGRAYRTPVA